VFSLCAQSLVPRAAMIAVFFRKYLHLPFLKRDGTLPPSFRYYFPFFLFKGFSPPCVSSWGGRGGTVPFKVACMTLALCLRDDPQHVPSPSLCPPFFSGLPSPTFNGEGLGTSPRVNFHNNALFTSASSSDRSGEFFLSSFRVDHGSPSSRSDRKAGRDYAVHLKPAKKCFRPKILYSPPPQKCRKLVFLPVAASSLFFDFFSLDLPQHVLVSKQPSSRNRTSSSSYPPSPATGKGGPYRFSLGIFCPPIGGQICFEFFFLAQKETSFVM